MREYNIHIPAHYDPSNNVAIPLVLDYHGWGGTTHYQMVKMPWREVADMDNTGFIYIALQGMEDATEDGLYGSWNVSRYIKPVKYVHYNTYIYFDQDQWTSWPSL